MQQIRRKLLPLLPKILRLTLLILKLLGLK
jgi:hypothetical protein